MSNYVICTKTKNYNELIAALENRNITFETSPCVKNCFRCRTKVMIQKDGKFISESTVEKLLAKIGLSGNSAAAN